MRDPLGQVLQPVVTSGPDPVPKKARGPYGRHEAPSHRTALMGRRFGSRPVISMVTRQGWLYPGLSSSI